MDDQDAAPPPGTTGVWFSMLGPLAVSVDGRQTPLGGLRPRALLAMLLAGRPASVSSDLLMEALWGPALPQQARNSLQSHVSRLRAAFADRGGAQLADRVRHEPGGYRLDVADDELDTAVVESALRRVRALDVALPAPAGEGPAGSNASDATAAAARLLEEALACWRGPALVEFAELPGWQTSGLAAMATRLEELRLLLWDLRFEVRLVAGEHDEVLPHLEQAASSQPLRERTQRLLATALYRCGRPSDALEVLRRHRARLVEDAGLDPPATLTALEQAILSQDEALARVPPSSAVRSPATLPKATRLPVPPALASTAPFVGREDDLERVMAALATSRLVTLTGPGGVGKTRLALEALARAGDEHDDAVVLELAPLRHGGAIVSALAAHLGVQAGARRPLVEAVVDDLVGQRLLLLVDNCEHLRAEAAAVLHQVLVQAPRVTVLATSRVRLGVDGEQVLVVGPLPSPSDGARLFADRARRARSGFALTDRTRPLVQDICTRLDGLPLAIELAAGQLGALGLADLRDRLDDRLDLLGADDRRGTLRTVVDRSYELLDEPERRAFEAVSAFDGGFTLAAAERVAGERHVARTLSRLVDASLVVASDGGSGRLRYTLLETLRAYAAERLAAAGTSATTAARHAAWAVDLVETAEQRLEGSEEAAWVHRIDTEIANIRSAWHSSLAGGDVTTAARITTALAPYAHWHGQAELWAWARRLAADERLDGSPLQVGVLGAAAQAAYLQGELAEAGRLARTGLRHPSDHPRRWWCVVALFAVAMYEGAFADAERHAAEAADAAGGAPTFGLIMRTNVALARLYAGDADAARTAMEPCRRQAPRVGSVTGRAWVSYVDGEIALTDDPAAASVLLQEAVTLARSVRATFIEGVAAVSLLSAATRAGHLDVALDRVPDTIRHWRRSGMWVQQWTTLRLFAELLVALGVDRPAAVLLAAADAAVDAPAVVGVDADRLTGLRDTLRRRLGPEEEERWAARGVALTPAEAVESALATAAEARRAAAR